MDKDKLIVIFGICLTIAMFAVTVYFRSGVFR